MMSIRSTALASRLIKVVMALAIVNLGSVASAAAQAQDRPVKIVAFGDSLTAGYLLPPEDAFPSQLQAALKAKGLRAEVANAGVSGDTTAAGLERLDWAVPKGTDAVILELGANDGLRGLAPADARKNLDQIITRLKARNITVLLAGMRAPSNWGTQYARDFDGMFQDLADKHGLLLYPFFLEGVAMNAALNLDDGLHPNAKGVAEIVRRILPSVEELIARTRAQKALEPAKS